ncbi:unnamed protein product [Prunus armeniaca]
MKVVVHASTHRARGNKPPLITEIIVTYYVNSCKNCQQRICYKRVKHLYVKEISTLACKPYDLYRPSKASYLMPSEMHKQKKFEASRNLLLELMTSKVPIPCSINHSSRPFFTKQVLQTKHYLPPINLFHRNKKRNKIPMSHTAFLQTRHTHVHIYPHKAKKINSYPCPSSEKENQ